MSIPTMQAAMAGDLSQLFDRDMPAKAKIGGREYTVLIDDSLSDESEAFGGPEFIDRQMIHFRTTDLAQIEIGSPLSIFQQGKWKAKVVTSSITSADGNELIATVRGA